MLEILSLNKVLQKTGVALVKLTTYNGIFIGTIFTVRFTITAPAGQNASSTGIALEIRFRTW